MDNKTKVKSIIALFAMGFVQIASTAATPALSAIASNFPTATETQIAAIATLPSFAGIPFTILVGLIAGRKVRFRTLACVGLTTQCIGGLLPYFANSMTAILIGRAIYGIGTGLTSPLITAITLALFTGEDLSKQVAINGMAGNIGAVVFVILGGVLCNIYWRLPFLAYLTFIPVLAVVFFMLPEPKKNSEDKGVKRQKIEWKHVFTGHVVFWCLFYSLYMIIKYPFITGLSKLVTENGYGNSVTCSIILAIYATAGTLGGKLFHKLNLKLGTKLLAFSFGLCAISYVFLILTDSALALYITAVIYGIGYGLNVPAITYFLGANVYPESKTTVSSIFYICNCAGTFASSYVMVLLKQMFNSTYDRFAYVVGLIFFVVAAVFFIFYRQKNTVCLAEVSRGQIN